MSIPHDDLLSQNTTFQTVQSIKEVRFGDGYGQRAEDGINNKRKVGTLLWIPLSKEDFDDIDEFWNQVGVVRTFLWASPDDIERHWRFTDGLSVANVGDKYLVSVSAQEEFE